MNGSNTYRRAEPQTQPSTLESCDDCALKVSSQEVLEEAYTASEYAHYLTQLINAVKENNIQKCVQLISKHNRRTQSLGGGPDLSWDMINDITQNWSPFHYSIYYGCEKIFLWMKQLGGDLKSITYDQWSCLCLAVVAKQNNMVKFMIAQDIDINYVSRKGTALHIAAANDSIDIIKILLNHPRISLTTLNLDLETPMDVASKNARIVISKEQESRDLQRSLNLVNSFRSSITLHSQNSFINNKPKLPPLFKGQVYKMHRSKLFMYPRFLVVDPQSGVMARFEQEEQYPLNPIEIIALDDIDNVSLSIDRWFQSADLKYVCIQYNNKSIFFVFQAQQTADEWIESIRLSIGYSRYIKEKIQSYSKEQKKLNKRIVQLLMANANNQVQIRDSLQGTTANTMPLKQDFEGLEISDFKCLSLIGRGAFGSVFQVKMIMNNKIYALKQQEKKQLQKASQLKYALNEIRLLKKLHYPFLVNMHCAFQTERYLYSLSDYYQNGDLSQYMTRGRILDEYSAKFIISEIILAIEYLSSQNIVYRDLKPENIVFDNDWHIKIIDFGLSKECRPFQVLDSFCGSPAYLSPEVVLGIGATKATDVYSIGLILYEMLHGYPPHYCKNMDELMHRIKKGYISYDLHNPQAEQLLRRVLNVDPTKRPTVGELKNDIFFASINFERLARKQLIPPKYEVVHKSKTLRHEFNANVLIDDQDYGQFKDNYIEYWDFH